MPDHHVRHRATDARHLVAQQTHHLGVRRALRQPAVGQTSGALDGGRAGTGDPDGRTRRLRGQRARTEAFDELVLESGGQLRDAAVERLAARVEVDAQQFELGLHVTGADADERSTFAEMVERGELFGGHARVAIRQHVHVSEQAHVGGEAGDPAEGGDGVGPVRAHATHRGFGKADVIAHADVGVPALVARARETGQLVRTGGLFPVRDEIGTLRLNG